MTTIADISQAVGAAASAAGSKVVGITGRRSAGSGVIVGADRVLTNAHNVFGQELTVTFADGRTASARTLGVDNDGDIAVLEVATEGAAAVDWNGSVPTEIGTPVFAVSNPGGRGLRVTFGLVSGTERSFRGPRGRRIAGSIEHTAPLLPGSSGGPIVDASGRLLGINTHRLGEGFYLAIPADEQLRGRVDSLSKGESPKPVRLGVAVAPAHMARRLRRAVGLPEVDGLLVRGVEQGSTAAKAGLQQGDLITVAGQTALKTADDLFTALEHTKGAIELKILRGTQERSVRVALT